MARHGLFKQVVGDLSLLTSSPFAKLLDSCLRSKSARDTRRIHARIMKTQFSSEIFIQNRLIDVYGKCGCLDDARNVFDKMPDRNTFTWNSILTALSKLGFLDESKRVFGSMPEPDQCSWNSMVSGFAQHDRFDESLEFFVQMHKENFELNEYSFGSALRACAGLGDPKMGIQIHASVAKSRYSFDVFMGSALIDMYAKCGSVACTRKVFDGMTERNIVSWNNLITCYEQNGPTSEALDVFVRMMACGFEPDEVSLASVVSACASLLAITVGREIHARAVKFEKFRDDLVLSNALVDMYAKCGRHDEARRVFGSMPEPDQCSWNSMVSGFAQHDRFDESLEFFVQMHKENFELNEYSFGSALRACAGLGDQKMGTQIHASVAKSRYSFNVFMGSALIDMYAKCGNVACARKVFDGMTERNIVSWNSLTTCYEQNGPTSEALDVFVRMMACGFEPDEVSLASVVSACASLLAITEGREIHARAVKFEKFRDDLVLSNALVDMYAKCGRLDEARRVFDSMPNRNVVSETSMVSGYAKAASVRTARLMFAKMTQRNIVSWNALIAGYTQNGDNEEALRLFYLLKRESVRPTHYTFGNLLNACANLAVLKLGRQAHTHVLKHGFRFQTGSEPDIFVGNSLIDMYMKCGSVEDGSLVFKNMVERDWVSWNAMIVGYAQNGHGAEALVLFKELLEAGEKPDHVTMIGVLCACSHAGLVEEGRHYFLSMSKDHGLEPQKDHYTCMVDLLGRAGWLDEAKNLIESMPMQPDSVVWASLLSACKVHGNIQLGKFVAENLLDIDPDNSGPYVLLSNMYAELRRWRDVIRVRKLMRQRGVVKQPGCSWIEIQSQVHVFMVKDKRHHQRKDIYLLLKTLTKQMKLAGYVPDTGELESDEEQNNSDLTPSGHLEIPEVAVGA